MEVLSVSFSSLRRDTDCCSDSSSIDRLDNQKSRSDEEEREEDPYTIQDRID
jgi:hypothetical protein